VPYTRHHNTNMKDEKVEIWKSKGIIVFRIDKNRRHVQELQESGSWGSITDRQAKSLWMYTDDR